MAQKSNIYLMRHGQTNGNIGNRLDGTTDTPLNHTGRGQAVVAAKEVAKLKIDHIFCSDLSRAHETAEIVNKMSIIKAGLDNVLIVCHGAIMLPLLHYARHQELNKESFMANEAQLVIGNTEIVRWE